MFIPNVFGARRLCFVANRPFMVSAITVRGWAHLLQWLDDFVPGQAERKGPPRFDALECYELRNSPEGQVFEVWLALQDQGVDYERATELWKNASNVELNRLHRVLFDHRRTMKPSEDDESDIAETWCGSTLATMAQTIGLDELGRYTLDQIEWLIREGDIDENPAFSPEKLEAAHLAMQEKWGDKLGALAANGQGSEVTNG